MKVIYGENMGGVCSHNSFQPHCIDCAYAKIDRLREENERLREVITGATHEVARWEDGNARLRQRLGELEREVATLRQYGNRDCTAMADEALSGRG